MTAPDRDPRLTCLDLVHAVCADPPSVETAWNLHDDNLRRCTAQAWLWANRTDELVAGHDLDELTAHLATGPHDSELWEGFADTYADELRGAWASTHDRGLAVSRRDRVLGLDLELVVLMGLEVAGIYTEPTLVEQLRFVTRYTADGWRVAALSDHIPTPGWPPDFR